MGQDGSRASAPVYITSANAPVTSVLSSLTATAETTYNMWEDNLEVTIIGAGAGFIPGEAVVVTILSLVNGADKPIVGTTANYSGAFIAQVTLYGPTPAEGADYEMPITPGVYTLLADGDSGSLATVCSPNPPLDAHRSTSPTMPSVVTSHYTGYHLHGKGADMSNLGGGGLIIAGVVLAFLGLVLRWNLIDWLIDFTGLLLIIIGIVLGVFGLIQVFSSRKGY